MSDSEKDSKLEVLLHKLDSKIDSVSTELNAKN